MSNSDDLHPEDLPEASGWPIHPAMVTSAMELHGFRIVRSYGVVQGLVVRSPGIRGGISASFQAMSGGNVDALQQMCQTARHDAFLMMMQDAVRYRANGILGFRYDTTDIGEGLTEVLAYGTAVSAETE
ncbi:MAG: heavy metal-binding domain-containing protein [Rubripirellula sp.]|nr:heavy metal-binding domain-containing protein [Rubripirellula sp.]